MGTFIQICDQSLMAALTPEDLSRYLERDAHLIYGVLDNLYANGRCPPGLEWLRSWTAQQVLQRQDNSGVLII